MKEQDCCRIPYPNTGYFSKIVADLLAGADALKPFAHAALSPSSLREFVQRRQAFSTDRNVLVQALQTQYSGVEMGERLAANLQLLGQENCFTITTAHQPNLATGPLYVVHKILHAIKLAAWCKKEMPELEFVPVFYLGSEDADADELNHFTVEEKKYEWESGQTGAVGRMKVNEALLQQFHSLEKQIDRLQHGGDWVNLLRKHYQPHRVVDQAFFGLIHELFGKHGLVGLLPDHALLKQAFLPVVQKELAEQFSTKAVAQTLKALQAAGYKVQAGGRDLNLFWLEGQERRRILAKENGFQLEGSPEILSLENLLAKAEADPRVWSPNVILRPVFQEMILPNIAFIGGGGEMAYWLELKQVFQDAQVPFPALVLRNSFALVPETVAKKWQSLGFAPADWFKPLHELEAALALRLEGNSLDLTPEIKAVEHAYDALAKKVSDQSDTLAKHSLALQKQSLNKLEKLQQKMIRLAKRRQEESLYRLRRLHSTIFPGGSLQERKENLASFYGQFGSTIIDILLENSAALPEGFTILRLPKSTDHGAEQTEA